MAALSDSFAVLALPGFNRNGGEPDFFPIISTKSGQNTTSQELSQVFVLQATTAKQWCPRLAEKVQLPSCRNDLINEMVRLHAVSGPTVTELEVPDRDRVQGEDRAVEEKFHPAAGFRARWHALSLIENGNQADAVIPSK